MHDPIHRYGGVDWATDAHAVCVVDGDGGVVAEFDVEHTAAGLAELCCRLRKARVDRVAIERPDGPVVDALMEAGLEVVVVSSRSIKALRERYGTAGNKSDRSDAYVLADCLRTDGHRWTSLKPDTPETVTLRSHVRARKDLVETRVDTRIGELLDAHPDAHIFTSLPRSGTVRAATLLAEIGDCRDRFPEPEALTCLAGVVPSTRASGRHRVVTFRWGADKKLRDALCDFAGDSWRANPWAETRYRQLRAAGKTHPHAERILARSWAHIIWRCWQDHTPYDPTKHTALQHLIADAA